MKGEKIEQDLFYNRKDSIANFNINQKSKKN